MYFQKKKKEIFFDYAQEMPNWIIENSVNVLRVSIKRGEEWQQLNYVTLSSMAHIFQLHWGIFWK